LNQVARSQKQRAADRDVDEGVDDYENYVAPINTHHSAAQPEHKKFYVPAPVPKKPEPVRFVEATSDAEARERERELEMDNE